MAEPSSDQVVLCSECFSDEGLRFGALAIGATTDSVCPNCGRSEGRKLDLTHTSQLAWQFFTWGSTHRMDYGGAPQIVSNDRRESDIALASWSGNDLRLFEEKLGLGFFLYGPRLWMVGEVYPLKALQTEEGRSMVVERILAEYPKIDFRLGEKLYRLRKGLKNPTDEGEYDSPPEGFLGEGRLESPDLPMLYGSRDLQTCVHECRLTVLDESFVATLEPVADMRLLDLTHLLREDKTEFESLDMAVHMLFLAGDHSYPITREIAKRAHEEKLDGILYPSFFSLARTGSVPFPTVLGMSVRRIPQYSEQVRRQTVPNVAIFGRPIKEGKIKVRCINRLILGSVNYGLILGPVGFSCLQSPQ
jgi:hypothetical protein